MTIERTTAIAELLAQAGNAHHHYEQTILNGVYHEEWTEWYADYTIAHGLNNLLANALTVDQLSHFLSEITDRHKSENPTINWDSYVAQNLVDQFAADTSQ
jgi:hypothetical protein